MDVQIISSVQIKPSSSTPPHLQLFKLSILDQLLIYPYAPLIFFYPKLHTHTSVDTCLDILKTALSQTLTQFYPLAGTVKDDLSILCNDVGARFVRSRVNCDLDAFLSHPDLVFLNRLLPCDVLTHPTAVSHVTNIQANVFDCGGLAIALCISHKILDGAAIGTFVKAWTSSARGGCSGPVIVPNFVSTSLFPANDSLSLRDSITASMAPLYKKGKFITRRFVFDASTINRLKERAEDADPASRVKLLSRVEAVSALLWKSSMAAWKEPSYLTHFVNLRRRMDPSLVENSVGNILWLATATSTMATPDLGDLVKFIREAISKIDQDFVKELQSNDGASRDRVMGESLREMKEKGGDHDQLLFTSWCKMGFYEVDFGWGKPVWVSNIGFEASDFLNFVVLVDTKSGDGVEAWVTMDEQDIRRLESDDQLLAFASLDPSPLI